MLPSKAEIDSIKVFYHGTSTHQPEIRWLKSVIGQVVAKDEHIIFELVGSIFTKWQFRNIPRVYVFPRHGFAPWHLQLFRLQKHAGDVDAFYQ